jgi:hypothetical protein
VVTSHLRSQHKLGSAIINMTQSRLAQGEDPILHIAHDRVGFNKDHNPPRADQGRKSLPSSYFFIFYLPNIYMQISPDVMLAWSSVMP